MTTPDTTRQPHTAGEPVESTPLDSGTGAGAGRLPRVTLLLFAAAREAARCARWQLEAETVADVLEQARQRFGTSFAAVLEGSKVWLNGEPALGSEPLAAGDEVAVLPPVSGG